MALGTLQMTITTGDVFLPEVWSRETQAATEATLVLANLTKRFDDELTDGGDLLRVPQISNLTANSKAANTQVTLGQIVATFGVIKSFLNIWNLEQESEASTLTQVDKYSILESMKKLLPTQLAWVAGFMDGEGSFMISYRPAQTDNSTRAKYGSNKEKKYLRKTDSYVPITQVCNTSLSTIKLFQSWFDGSIREYKNVDGHKTVYGWKLNNGSQMIPFLESVKPYLIIKKKQCEILISLIGTLNKYGDSTTQISEETKNLRVNLHKQIRDLNRRGCTAAETNRRDSLTN